MYTFWMALEDSAVDEVDIALLSKHYESIELDLRGGSKPVCARRS